MSERGTHHWFFCSKILAKRKPCGKNSGEGFVSELPESESEVSFLQKNLVQPVCNLMSLTVLNCTSSKTFPLHKKSPQIGYTKSSYFLIPSKMRYTSFFVKNMTFWLRHCWLAHAQEQLQVESLRQLVLTSTHKKPHPSSTTHLLPESLAKGHAKGWGHGSASLGRGHCQCPLPGSCSSGVTTSEE